MTAACDLVSVELRLDRIEGELASELPAHVRMFAQCYARGAPVPPAPPVLHRLVTLATARVALGHPFLSDRGLALLRLVAPIAIDDEPAVVAARAQPPSWAALAALTRARDAAAEARFGRRAIDVLHRLAGVQCEGADGALPAAIAGWTAPDGCVIDLEGAWLALAARHGVRGVLRIERADGARPRTFVVEPGREAIIVVPATIATPADRFAVLHELGHAIVGLCTPAGAPRALDEAVAAYVARGMERDGAPWGSPLAAQARSRRSALARSLDRLERDLPRFRAPADTRPPWALWHDAGAQASYVTAEAVADALDAELGGSPAPGALLAAIARHRAAIDRIDPLP